MKKILLPIDGSPRSLRAIQAIKQTYGTEEVDITILYVIPDPRPSKLTDENDEVKPVEEHEDVIVDPQTAEETRLLLDSFAKLLPGYTVATAQRSGKPGPEIIHFAKEGAFDYILMTRSSRGSTQKLGSVSTYVVSNAAFVTTTVLKEA